MVIQTEKAVYEVIQRLEESQSHRAYLCREASETRWLYLVNAYLGEELPREHIMYFMGLSLQGELADFEECFFQSGYLYVIFRESTAPALEQALATEKMGLRQRLDIGKNLTEQVLQKQLPDYLLYEALRSDNVRVDSNSEVTFCYHLRERERINESLFSAVCERLAKLHQALLSKELEAPAALPLKKVIDTLNEGGYESYKEICQAYRRAYEAVVPLIQNDTLVMETWQEKILRYAKAVVKQLKKWLVVIVLVVLLVILIYSILHPNYRREPLNFASVGEIQLGGGEMGEVNGGRT